MPTGQTVTVLDGAVKVGVPAGYCVDPGAGQAGADTTVVVMGRCDAGAAPAVISLTVGQAGSGQVLSAPGSYLAGYFMSPAGRAAMASDGRAGSVTVEAARVSGAAVLLRLADRSLGTYWRGIAPVAGRAVTVSVTAADAAAGENVLQAALAAMARANASP